MFSELEKIGENHSFRGHNGIILKMTKLAEQSIDQFISKRLGKFFNDSIEIPSNNIAAT